jgi:thiamine pyrophosphate-dependent acetolactate synthase large subunit-like protein
MPSVAEVVAASLRDAGVERVFGAALPGLEHVPVGDPALAALLADADGRLGPAAGAALLRGSVLRISSRPGAVGRAVRVDDPRHAYRVVHRAASAARFGHHAFSIGLDVDLDAPAPDPPEPQAMLSPLPDLELQLDLPNQGVVMLAGPGVVRAAGGPWGDTVKGLQSLAGAAGVGVVNTWGAKGVFTWDSPHHLGTAGLQADDFELLGFRDAQLIVATGVDRDESADRRFALSPVVDISPVHLAGAASRLRRPLDNALSGAAANALYAGMAAIAQPGYLDASVPLHPARAVADARAALPAGGVVAAEPGVAGLWVARTFPTSVLGSVIVPATRAPGIAAALAFVASYRGRAALAVTASPVDTMTLRVLDLAGVRRTSMVIDVWGDDATVDTPDAHLHALTEAFRTPGVHVVSTPVAKGRTGDLIEVAGPVVAWGGIDLGG